MKGGEGEEGADDAGKEDEEREEALFCVCCPSLQPWALREQRANDPLRVHM